MFKTLKLTKYTNTIDATIIFQFQYVTLLIILSSENYPSLESLFVTTIQNDELLRKNIGKKQAQRRAAVDRFQHKVIKYQRPHFRT